MGGKILSAVTILAALQGARPAAAQSIQEWLGLRWQLCRMEVDGTGLKTLDQTPGRRCGSPQWSPDGQLIAYDVMGDGDGYGDAQVVVIRADGSDSHVLGRGAVPSWSPGGKLIVCQSNTEEGAVVMNPDGSGREAVFYEGSGLQFSPRGDQLFTVSNRTGGGGGIWLFDLATGKKRQIFPGPYAPFHGYGVSADGLRICFWVGNLSFRRWEGERRSGDDRPRDDARLGSLARRVGYRLSCFLGTRRSANRLCLATDRQ